VEALSARKPSPRFTDNVALEVVLEDLTDVLVRLRSGSLKMQAMHVAALWSAAPRIFAGDGLPESVGPIQRRLRAVFT
jgi:hypothetical protein